jgi:U4/U6.U5 tri-snRNP-associated protein 3
VHIKLGKGDGKGPRDLNAIQPPHESVEPNDGYADDDDAMAVDEEEDDIVVDDDGMAAMQAMMGFGSFDSTKGKKIKGNNVGAVRKEKKTEYRQYMNRVGGFNRPLSPGK